jgi:hypothetical protein
MGSDRAYFIAPLRWYGESANASKSVCDNVGAQCNEVEEARALPRVALMILNAVRVGGIMRDEVRAKILSR